MREGERKVILNNVFPKASYMTTMDNLGHETINLFKADEGFFLHLNANGTYSHSKEGAVDVLNLSYVGKGLYQIISKAINCKVVKGAEITRKDSGEKRYNEQKEAIHYAHIPVYKFFKGNITMKGKVEKDLFATFKCDRIVEPKKSIFIAFKESNLLEDTSPYILGHYRLDCITDIRLTDEPATPLRSLSGHESGIDYKEYATSLPYMFTDKPERVEFLADPVIIDQIVDWFGDNAHVEQSGDKLKVYSRALRPWQ